MASTTDPRTFVTTSLFDLDRRKTEDDRHNGNASAALIAATKTIYDDVGRDIEDDAGTAFSGTTVTAWQTMKTTTYTPTSKVDTVTDADSRVTDTNYDDGDRVLTVTDPVSRKVHYAYCTLGDADCAANQVKREVHAWVSGAACTQAGTLQQCYRRPTYWPDGELKTLQDANGNTTNYDYDGWRRLKTTTFPDASYEQLTLDEDGNVTSRRNRANETLNYSYNALDWVTQKTSPNPAVTDTWTYLLDGRIDVLSDNAGTGNSIDYGYDTAGRLNQVKTKIPGLTIRTVAYTLDANGNRTKLAWPSQDAAYYAGYCYDALNRMTAATENTTDCATGKLATYAYDALSRRTSVTYGNGASMSYPSYSAAGDLLTLTHNLSGTADDNTYTYTYTNAHQLLSETSALSSWLWQPAANGTDAYAAANNLNQYPSITPSGGSAQALGYDLKGNLASGNISGSGSWTFLYDAENRMLTADKTTGGTVHATYAYDPLGRRTKKSGTGVTTTYFLSDGTDEIAEYSSAGAVTTRYVPGPAIDEPIAMQTAATGAHEYFHTNHQGSVVAMSDDSGAKAEGPYTYDAYGNCFSGGSPCSATGEPYRFTGRRWDAETGFYYYRARCYSPTLGRFCQTDPVGYDAGMNLYTGFDNDPTDMTDPTGMSCTGDPGNRTCQIDKIVDAKGNTIDPSGLSREQAGAINAFNARYTREVNRLDKANKTTKLSLPTKADQNKNVSVDVSSSQLAGALAGRTVAACPSCEGNPHTEKGVTTLSSPVYEGRTAPAQSGRMPSPSGAMAVFRHEGLHDSPMEAQLLRAAGATVDDLDSHRTSGMPPGYAAGLHQAPYDAAAIDLGP